MTRHGHSTGRAGLGTIGFRIEPHTAHPFTLASDSGIRTVVVVGMEGATHANRFHIRIQRDKPG